LSSIIVRKKGEVVEVPSVHKALHDRCNNGVVRNEPICIKKRGSKARGLPQRAEGTSPRAEDWIQNQLLSLLVLFGVVVGVST
jgi:hypothetical protein